MQIGVLGINFKSAGIGTREFVSKACQKQISRISPVAKKYACVVLSTCNRTEIFFSANNLAEAHSNLLNILREEISVSFEHRLYSYFGFDCFMHLARVTSGLDSAIVAESEIQRQVKIAYEQTHLHYSLPSCMHYLFQKSLKLGKEIRSGLSFSQNQITIAKILFEISQQMFKDLSKVHLLFIGNSEINRRIMVYFKRKGVEKMSLCTRSLRSTQEMAEKGGFSLIPWAKLSTWKDYPLVICGSNTPHYIVSNSIVESYSLRPQIALLNAPKPQGSSAANDSKFNNESLFATPESHMPPYDPKPQYAASGSIESLLVFDLGVPRNVDPALSRHPKLTLLNMEELSCLIESRQRKNSIEINRAEIIIAEGVQRYLHAFRQKENRVFEGVVKFQLLRSF